MDVFLKGILECTLSGNHPYEEGLLSNVVQVDGRLVVIIHRRP
jgi:hypothetical protein